MQKVRSFIKAKKTKLENEVGEKKTEDNQSSN